MAVIRKMANKYYDLPLVMKAGIWFFICSFLQRGISIVTTPIFTRLLSTSEYGLYSIYISWTDFLSILITFGLSSSVYQKKLVQIDDELERNRFTSSLQGLATLTMLITCAIYLVFRNAVNAVLGLPTNMVLSIFLANLATTTYGFWAMRQRVDYKYKKLVMLTIFTSIAKPAFGIIGILLFPEIKVDARVYSLVFVEVIAYGYLYIKHFREGKTFFVKKYWKYAMFFVLPLIPHYISQRVLSQSDRIMINTLVGSGEAGIYSLASSIGGLMILFVNAFDNTLAPWTYNKLRDRDTKSLRQFSPFPAIFMAVLCLAFISVTPELVKIFASSDYYDAIWIVPPMAMSAFFIMIYTLFIYVEYYYEKTKMIMIATIIDAGLNIGLNYLFIQLFGYFASAYVSLFCYILYALFHYFVMRQVCNEQFGCVVYDMKKIFLISVLFCAVGFVMMFLYNYAFVRFTILLILMVGLIVKRDLMIGMLD